MALQHAKSAAIPNVIDQNIARRSGNYRPPIWEDNYMQSLKSDYKGELCSERAAKLLEQVRMMLEQPDNVTNPSEQLELVDTLQRIGLSYRFENETKRILESVWASRQSNVARNKGNLYTTGLEFRLQRQLGYKVTQEVFSSFLDENGNFKEGLCEDCKGLLSLYEASYLSVEGESMLENARDFAAKYLKEYVKQNKDDQVLSVLVEHALEVPLHWRTPRMEARWFIDVYESREDRNPILLELAKLDFNIVQAIHQDDLKYLQNWWKHLCLGETLPFARDRLVENFLWAIGVAPDSSLGKCRRNLVKVGLLITVIDDIYDVYGTMDELVLFTEAVERWDTDAMDLLPKYMKICFLALFNFVNEMAFDNLKEHGIDTLPLLKKLWANQCKTYLLEAKWYHSRYKPTLQEYIDNGLISISYPVLLLHSYLVTSTSIRKECWESLKECTGIIKSTSVVGRLANDLGTSSLKRGDVPKSIQCYIHETGASEGEARRHVRGLIDATWKKMNEERITNSHFSWTFIQIALNLSRMGQCMYQHGDGHGMGTREIKDHILSTIFYPI